MKRSTLGELVRDGRITVRFLNELADRLDGRDQWLDLVLDCRRLAAILSTAVEAIRLELIKENEA